MTSSGSCTLNDFVPGTGLNTYSPVNPSSSPGLNLDSSKFLSLTNLLAPFHTDLQLIDFFGYGAPMMSLSRASRAITSLGSNRISESMNSKCVNSDLMNSSTR